MPMRFSRGSLLLITYASLASGVVMFGQQTASPRKRPIRIFGVVRSPEAPVSGAVVTMKEIPGNYRLNGRTNASGRFELETTELGYYLVTIEAPGFLPKRAGVVAWSEDIDLRDLVMDVDRPCPPPPPAALPASQVIVTTVCEIMRNPERFNGAMVQFRAKVFYGFEASLLIDDPYKIWLSAGLPQSMVPPTQPLPTPSIVVLRDGEFDKMTRYLGARFRDSTGTRCESCPLYKDVIVDAVGLFQYIDKLALPRDQARQGFGHMGLYDSQLVLRQVANVTATSIEPGVYQ